MNPEDEHPEEGGGYDAEDWTRLTPFAGAVASLEDVQARRAVFALADTQDPRYLAAYSDPTWRYLVERAGDPLDDD